MSVPPFNPPPVTFGCIHCNGCPLQNSISYQQPWAWMCTSNHVLVNVHLKHTPTLAAERMIAEQLPLAMCITSGMHGVRHECAMHAPLATHDHVCSTAQPCISGSASQHRSMRLPVGPAARPSVPRPPGWLAPLLRAAHQAAAGRGQARAATAAPPG